MSVSALMLMTCLECSAALAQVAGATRCGLHQGLVMQQQLSMVTRNLSHRQRKVGHPRLQPVCH